MIVILPSAVAVIGLPIVKVSKRVIVPPDREESNSITSPPKADNTAARKLPGPLSSKLVTVKVFARPNGEYSIT